jgi:hypothetical protein
MKLSAKESYLDIGHGMGNKSRYIVWAYMDGEVKKSPIIDPSKGERGDHWKYFGHVEGYYIGRYEVDTQNLTIVIPEDPMFKFRKIPNPIISSLKSAFPNIKKIHVFNAAEGLLEPQETYGQTHQNWYKKATNEEENVEPWDEKDWIVAGREVFEVDGLRYMKSKYTPYDVLYEINVAALDEGWKKDIHYYFKPGFSDAREKNFREWMKKDIPIEAPEVFIDVNGAVAFGNGRHRFMVIRDMGKAKTVIAVSKEQDPRILRQMGARKLG